MPQRRSLEIGTVFGSWTTTTSTYLVDRRSKVRCVCACGRRREVFTQNLTRGLSTSCGACLQATLPKAGDTVGSWSVLSVRGNRAQCRCVCGTTRDLYIYSMLKDSRSCGCTRRNDGRRRAKLRRILSLMIERCHVPETSGWKDYGARGIYVCDEWRYNFTAFYEWAIANGYQHGQGLQIDRQDYNGPYCPANCRWVDKYTNARNKRNTVYLEAFGERMPLMDWLSDPRCIVSEGSLRSRVSHGWSIEHAMTAPKGSRKG